jgi:hypothetical protein
MVAREFPAAHTTGCGFGAGNAEFPSTCQREDLSWNGFPAQATRIA